MLKGFRGAPVVVLVAYSLATGHTAAGHAAAPQPESEQVVSAEMKKLYMAAAAAAPQSQAQQSVIRQMAEKAANGKEVLLAMRAAVGAFPAFAGSQEDPAERQVRSLLTSKMMDFGTLDQLIEYAKQSSVYPESARPFVERMFQLAGPSSDKRVWYRIKVAAARLKVADLERQAQVKADQLAGK